MDDLKRYARCGATVRVSDFFEATVTDDAGGAAIALCGECARLVERPRCVGCGVLKTRRQKAGALHIHHRDHRPLPICDECRDRWLRYECDRGGGYPCVSD